MESTTTIRLPGLEHNERPSLTPLQSGLSAHMYFFVGLWWCVWTVTLAILVTRYVILPFIAKRR